MKRLPNIISCSRIALSVLLMFLTDEPVLFIIVYFMCGISDVADGYLARLLDAQTALGAKLDSIGDFIFFAVGLYVIMTFVNVEDAGLITFIVVFVAVARTVNIVITKVKFKQWGIMHTIGNKLTGAALFLLLPICSLANAVPIWSVVVLGLTAILSSLEESAILLKSESYDVDRKSILFLIKNGIGRV